MPIDKNDLIRLRPCAYHVCSHRNLPSIRAAGRLLTASHLLRSCSLQPGEKRIGSVSLRGAHGEVVLRDHRPFALGAVDFEAGWGAKDYIAEHLDGRVFFWPGFEDRPIARGRKHFGRYSKIEKLAVLRITTRDLIQHNESVPMEVTKCNSGSARMQKGQKVRRGPSTFQRLDAAPWRASQVVELTFQDSVVLPAGTQLALSIEGPWVSLWSGQPGPAPDDRARR